MAKYSPEDLKTLVSDPSSDVYLKKISQKIPLQPVNLGNHVKAVKETLNRRLCKYDALLNGLVLGYQKLEVTKKTAQLHFDSSEVSVQAQAEFYVFQPQIGHKYKGVVHNIGVAHVGCLLYNHFNVSLPIPPEKGDLLKTLTPQTEVSFKLVEQTLPGDLPYFRGELVGLSSKSADKSAKKEKRKDKRDGSETSPSLLKADTDGSKKKKMDKESKLALKSQCAAGSSGKEKVDKHAKLSLKRGEVSDKKKPRLSLKQVEPSREVEKDITSAEDDSDHTVTPYQRQTENRISNLSTVNDDSLRNDKMKQRLESMRVSPLKEIEVKVSSDDDSTDISRIVQSAEDFYPRFFKSPQNSSHIKSSQSETREKSQKVLSGLRSPKVDVQSKSPGGKNSGSKAQKSSLPPDDTSSEDEKGSSSDESEDGGRKQPMFPQTPTKLTSPQKKSTPVESQKKVKDQSQKPDLQSKSPKGKISVNQSSKSILPSKADDSSSEDEDSSSEDSEDKGKKQPVLPLTHPKQTSPQKGKSTPTKNSPKTKAPKAESSSEDSGDEARKTSVLPLTKLMSPQRVKNTATESSSKAKSQKSKKALSLSKKDVLAKSPVNKNSESQAQKLPQRSKAEESLIKGKKESSSEDSLEEGEKGPALFQTPFKHTSPQKLKSPLAESPSKLKVKSPALAKLKPGANNSFCRSSEFQASMSSSSLKVTNNSSEESDSDGDCRESPFMLQTSFLKEKDSPIATSTQRSPQRQSSSLNISKHRVSSSDDESEEEVLQVSRLAGSIKVTGEPQKSPVKKHVSSKETEDSDSRPGKQREKPSDFEDYVPKTPAQTRSENPPLQRPAAPVKGLSSDKSDADKQTPASAGKMLQLPKDSSSDSDSEGNVAAPAPPHVRNFTPMKTPFIKSLQQRKKSLLSQTLDVSVYGRSPVACSTPTVESTASSHKHLVQNVKGPTIPDVRDVGKTDEPKKKKKKKKESKVDKVKDQLKLTDSGFEDLNVVIQKIIEGSTKEGKEDKPAVSSNAETKRHKKSKRKSKLEDEPKEAAVTHPTSSTSQTFKQGKDKKDSSKAKDEKHLVEKLKGDGVFDFGRKQSEVETHKPVDGMKSTEDVASKKSRKRKLSELTGERSDGLPNPDLLKDEDLTKSCKKRKLFAPAVDESVSKINESALESFTSKPKESRKRKTSERIGELTEPEIKVKELIPLGQADSKESRTVTSEPSNSVASTHKDLKRKESDSLENYSEEDGSVSPSLLAVINKYIGTSEFCDKKKKKKKIKDCDVGTDKSTRDVTPSVELMEKIKSKKKKEKAADENKIKKSAQDSASAVKSEIDIGTKIGNQIASKSQTNEEVHSEKKLKKKKKEKPISLVPNPAHQILSLSVQSAVPSKKSKTDKTKSTDEKLKRNEKETPINVVPVTHADPSLSVDSAASSKKKKKTDKTKSTDEEKKKKENPSNVASSLKRELSPSLSVDSAVSVKKKKSAITTDSDDSKVSVMKKKKKKRKEDSKSKISAKGEIDSRTIDDMVNSLLRNFS